MSRGNRIHLPGDGATAPGPDTPTLLSCANCGLLCMVPFAIFTAAAQSHAKGCLGPLVRRLVNNVLDPTDPTPDAS